jgi:hypothetical protein
MAWVVGVPLEAVESLEWYDRRRELIRRLSLYLAVALLREAFLGADCSAS